MKLSAFFGGILLGVCVCVCGKCSTCLCNVNKSKKDEHGKNMMHWMWSFFLILFKIQGAGGFHWIYCRAGGFHCSTYSVWSIDISGATPRRLWPHGSCGLWSTPYPIVSWSKLNRFFLVAFVRFMTAACNLLSTTYDWQTFAMPGVQTHPPHIITTKAPTRTKTYSAATTNKNKTHRRRGQKSFCLFTMSLSSAYCYIATSCYSTWFPYPSLGFPTFPYIYQHFVCSYYRPILRQFCCKPSGGKHVSLHGRSKARVSPPKKKHNNDKDGDLIAISMTNVSIVLQWPHHCN